MSDTTNQPKNYEEIFIAIIEYIRDHPRCDREECLTFIYNKFNLEIADEQQFVSNTIEKVSTQHSLQRSSDFHTRYAALIIHPDALFYLMEYQELKHSLEESKQAKIEAKKSMQVAKISIVLSIVFSVLSLVATWYYSTEQIQLSKDQFSTPDILAIRNNERLESLLKEQKKQNEILIQITKEITNDGKK